MHLNVKLLSQLQLLLQLNSVQIDILYSLNFSEWLK